MLIVSSQTIRIKTEEYYCFPRLLFFIFNVSNKNFLFKKSQYLSYKQSLIQVDDFTTPLCREIIV